jgi:hypothetical protein
MVGDSCHHFVKNVQMLQKELLRREQLKTERNHRVSKNVIPVSYQAVKVKVILFQFT